MTLKVNRVALRSIHGQLILLGGTFLGAIVLAVAALCLRSVLFEPYIREKFPPLPESLETILDDVAKGRRDSDALATAIEARVKRLSDPERPRAPDEASARGQVLTEVYGAWIDAPDFDPAGRLARPFFSEYGRFIIERVRQTQVVGNERQRLRALDLLRYAPFAEVRAEARQLCDYARQRAQRRNEAALGQHAQEVLHQLGPAGK
jgi:hypothetical protein